MKYKWPLLSFVSVLSIVTTYYFISSSPSTIVEVPSVNELPILNVKKMDGTKLMLSEAMGKVVLIFFSPDCDHCQNEAKQIQARKQVFKDYNVYFVAADSMKNIVQFAGEYDLVQSNFHFAQAEAYDVYKSVGPMPSIPAIFIYNNKRLIKKFEGEIGLDEVMKFL